ncbi:unnamed protein product [Phaeothamnion confervicola]
MDNNNGEEAKANSSDEEKLHNVADEFYDDEADNADEVWAAENMRPKSKGQKEVKSDADLSCPACFTLVCTECQRHEGYKNQFRALFVMNVTVQGEEMVLKEDAGVEERLRGVRCSECGTDLGVIDEEEVYHFFNVIPTG